MTAARSASLERGHGPGPVLVFCHATGFCKEVWLPVIDDLAGRGARFSAVALDQRHHGESQGFGDDYDWWRLGEDVVAAAAGRGPVIGVGHSGGGAAVAMAEILAPGTLAAAVLIEPIIPPPPFRLPDSHPLAEGARRRRERFASYEAAYAAFHGRGPFAAWDDRALLAYVHGGFRPEGDGVALRCAREAEAQYFLHAWSHGLWDRLHALSGPVTLLAGEHSDTHQQPVLAALEERMTGAEVEVEVVPGASHFLPMERPGLVADRIAAVVGRAARRGSEDDAGAE